MDWKEMMEEEKKKLKAGELRKKTLERKRRLELKRKYLMKKRAFEKFTPMIKRVLKRFCKTYRYGREQRDWGDRKWHIVESKEHSDFYDWDRLYFKVYNYGYDKISNYYRVRRDQDIKIEVNIDENNNCYFEIFGHGKRFGEERDTIKESKKYYIYLDELTVENLAETLIKIYKEISSSR
ncbi:MAG: hypothetical protein ACKKMO_01105 [Candidatus Nealsonbacteria bacterium]